MTTDNPSALSLQGRQAFTEAMLQAGRSQGDIDKALAPVERGPIDPNGRSFASAADADAAINASRTAAQDKIRANMQTHTAPPEGGAYDLNFKEHAQGMDLNTLVRTATELRTAFSVAKIPAQLGQPLADALLSSERTVARLNASQLAQWKVEQRAMLSRLPGGIEGQLRDAAIATAALPASTRDAWLKSGRLESTQAIVFLAHAGKAIAARQTA